MIYAEVEKENVIKALEAGEKLIVCDFATMRMMNCFELQITALMHFITKPEALFFKVVANE